MNTVKVTKNKKATNWITDLKFEQLPTINDVAFIKDEIAFILNDGRIIYVPLKWSKKLLKANHQQRSNYINSGVHVFWDDVDEIIGVKNILFGKELFV